MKSAVRSMSSQQIVSTLAPALVAAAVALCLVSFAMPARAASLTSDQLSNVDALLQSYGVSADKINAVSAVLSDNGGGNGQMGSTSPCAVPSRPLVEGMRSDDVATLQNRLVGDGYLSQDNATGYFGPSTEAALKQWQADQGVVASGTPETTGWGAVGQKTIQALGKCSMRMDGMQNGDNASSTPRNDAASSTPGMPPRTPRFPGGSGTPVPQGTDSAAGAVGQFISDYSDSFNQNMAAVASAPYQFYVPMLSSFFYSLGIR